jgi:hypothetical protein
MQNSDEKCFWCIWETAGGWEVDVTGSEFLENIGIKDVATKQKLRVRLALR